MADISVRKAWLVGTGIPNFWQIFFFYVSESYMDWRAKVF